jgi:hypothetical protein
MVDRNSVTFPVTRIGSQVGDAKLSTTSVPDTPDAVQQQHVPGNVERSP